MTIVYNRVACTVHTTVCPLCGVPRGEGWKWFSDHVLAEHGPEDAGLTPTGGDPEPRKALV